MTEDVKVELGGEVTGFRRAIKEMEQSAKDGSRNIESSFSGLNRTFDSVRSHVAALGVAVSAGAFTALIKNSIDAADHLYDMSQRTGMSVEVLAGLKLVADQSGTSLEGLGTAFKRLSVNLVDASAGNKEMSTVFKGLGISGTNAQEAMYRLADIMKTLPDGAQKTALAVKLLGRAGEEMIPLLNQGGAELRKMVEHGQKLTGVTKEMAEQADQFNDQMAELAVQSQATGIAMAKYALPALNDIAAAMREAAKEGGMLQAVWVGLGGVGAAMFTDEFAGVEKKIKNLQFDIDRLLFNKSQVQPGSGLLHKWLYGNEKSIDAEIQAKMQQIEALKKSMEKPPKPADDQNRPAVDVAKLLGAGKKADTGEKTRAPDSYMPTYEAALAEKKNQFEQENVLRQFSKQQELAYWRELMENYQVTAKDKLAIAKRTSILELDIRRDLAKQQLDLDVATVEQSQATATAQVAIDEARAQAELDNGLTTKEQFLEQEEQFEARRYEIALTALAQRIALAEKDPTRSPAEISKLYAEVDQLDTQHQIKRIQMSSQMAQESGQIWKDLGDRMSGLWDKGVQALMNGTLTWRNGMKAVGAEVVAWFARDVVGKQVKLWIMGEASKTGATQIGTAARLILESGAALKSIGIGAMAAIKKIMNAAAETFAGIFAFLSPEMGPFAAIPAAAGAGAVAAMTGKVMSARGGYDIPRGINPLTQLHEQEMVLPKEDANVIRSLRGDTADTGSGGGVTVNYHDHSGRLTLEEIQRNAHNIVKVLNGQARNFAFSR